MDATQPYIRPPTVDDILKYASEHGISLTETEASEYTELIESKLGVLRQLEQLPDPMQNSEYNWTDRKMGSRPTTADDPYNAFVRNCVVAGADSGPLAGVTVGIKDNIAVAGVEMTAGSKVYEGYVPTFDAAVVSRLLDAGADVVGKTNLDELAVSGSGEPTASGPILNPHSDQHLAGGSSGGAAVALATRMVPIADGSDMMGSLRNPAGWTNVYGMRPSWGRVPAEPQGDTFLHPLSTEGPMGRSPGDLALLLGVMSGPDPRQPFGLTGTGAALTGRVVRCPAGGGRRVRGDGVGVCLCREHGGSPAM